MLTASELFSYFRLGGLFEFDDGELKELLFFGKGKRDLLLPFDDEVGGLFAVVFLEGRTRLLLGVFCELFPLVLRTTEFPFGISFDFPPPDEERDLVIGWCDS